MNSRETTQQWLEAFLNKNKTIYMISDSMTETTQSTANYDGRHFRVASQCFLAVAAYRHMMNNGSRGTTQSTAIYDGWHFRVVSQCFLAVGSHKNQNGGQAHAIVSIPPSSQDAAHTDRSWDRRRVRPTSPCIEVGRLTLTPSPDTAETGDYISVVRHLMDSREVTVSDNVRFE